MYYIILNSDSSLYGSGKEKIIQREKLFNKLCFLIPPYYKGFDMTQCTVTMRYLLPISKEFRTETLILSEERHEEYLKYILPIDSNFTREWGDITLNLTFTMLDVENGNVIQHVGKTTDCHITITQIPDWDAVIPDSSLMAIDQRILRQDAQLKALEDLANTLESNKADNLRYDDNNDTLQLTSNGVGIGNKVYVKDMLEEGIPVVDLNSSSGSDDSDDDTNGDCNDNVVEFGYDSNIPNASETSDDNVVEF